MLTLTKYAFIVLAIILAILAINFGRSKYILTGNQSVSLAFYRYTIAQSDITAEFPSNVLARITPTSAETTLMQNTGLIMQYKIDYTAANLVDVGWTAYDSNNQPAILDDCTISCRYYGAASTSGGVAFTGPETTKEIKLPKIKTLDGTTLILTEEGTASTADSFAKASDYYGEAIDYQGNTSDTKTYRLFYVDFDNKYKDGQGTIYLKADWTVSNVCLERRATYNPQNEKDETIIANMNQQWKDAIDANGDGKINSGEIKNINGHASAWLASPSQWVEYANGNANKTGETAYTYTSNDENTSYVINYAIGGPSAEMFADSYSLTHNVNYTTVIADNGYKYSIDGGANSATWYADAVEYDCNSMYSMGGNKYYWISSPNNSSIATICSIAKTVLNCTVHTNVYGVCPIISIQPTTINEIGNYAEVNTSNRIIKGYSTLAEAMTGVTDTNTIKVLNGITESANATVNSNKTITLDLNDKTITTGNFSVINNGNLIVTDTSTNKTGAINATNRVFANNGAGVLTINLGTFTTSAVGSGHEYAVIDHSSTGTVTLNGGTLTAQDLGIIVNNSGDVVINNASIKSYQTNAVYGLTSGNFEINGGTLEGTSGIDILGSLLVTGGTITGTSNDGIYIRPNVTVNITGGTVTGNTNGIAIYEGTATIGNNTDSVNTSIPTITGNTRGVYNANGTFNYYDGVIYGQSGANSSIRGTINATPSGYHEIRSMTSATVEKAELLASYKLTLNAGDGSIPQLSYWNIANDTKTAYRYVADNQTIPAISIPQKTGYTFDGYYASTDDYVEAAYTKTSYAAPISVIRLSTLDASNGWTMTSADAGRHIQATINLQGTNLTNEPSHIDCNDVTLTKGTQYYVSGSSGNWTVYVDFDITEYMITRTNYTGHRFIDIEGSGYGESDVTCTISNFIIGNKRYYDSAGNVVSTEPLNADTTIYAKWTPNVCQITNNANGGTIPTATGWTLSNNSQTATANVTYNQSLIDAGVPMKTGYTFKGYFQTNDDYVDAVYTENALVSGQTRLKLDYNANNWAYTTEGDAGKHIQARMHFVGENLVSEPRFDFNDVSLVKNQEYFVSGQSGNWIVYFDFDITSNMVSYKWNTDYETEYRFIDVIGSDFSGPNITLTTDFFIIGNKMYYDSNGEGVCESDFTEDTTLYAKWEANKYTLTLNANGGILSSKTGWTISNNSSMATAKAEYNANLIDACLPTKSGYTFMGYYKNNSEYKQVKYQKQNLSTSSFRIDTVDAENNWTMTSAGDTGKHFQAKIKLVGGQLTNQPTYIDFNDRALEVNKDYFVTGSSGNWTIYMDFDLTQVMAEQYGGTYRFIDINGTNYTNANTTMTVEAMVIGNKMYYDSSGLRYMEI